MVRTTLLTALVIALPAAPACAVFTRPPVGPMCARAADEVARSPQVRVVRGPGGAYLGCTRTRRRGITLAWGGCGDTPSSSCFSVSSPVVAGRWFAAGVSERNSFDGFTDAAMVQITDVVRRRQWSYEGCPGRWYETSASGELRFFSGEGSVRRVLVDDRGQAVVVARDRRGDRRDLMICAAAPGGNSWLVARSPGIDPASVRLHAGSVRWREAGQARDEVLRPR